MRKRASLAGPLLTGASNAALVGLVGGGALHAGAGLLDEKVSPKAYALLAATAALAGITSGGAAAYRDNRHRRDFRNLLDAVRQEDARRALAMYSPLLADKTAEAARPATMMDLLLNIIHAKAVKGPRNASQSLEIK
jgi:cobalamin biosynthesis protein CobD/CbiB